MDEMGQEDNLIKDGVRQAAAIIFFQYFIMVHSDAGFLQVINHSREGGHDFLICIPGEFRKVIAQIINVITSTLFAKFAKL